MTNLQLSERLEWLADAIIDLPLDRTDAAASLVAQLEHLVDPDQPPAAAAGPNPLAGFDTDLLYRWADRYSRTASDPTSDAGPEALRLAAAIAAVLRLEADRQILLLEQLGSELGR